ncbi:methyltransferase domain-containing protein [Sanyastnella coralliicola]|uniref:methyltransferase domain-containing protein n=1 Tax=Sanyastnella coralliicola TaxID=3069118 RepID=UPI0027B9D3F1|nr:methyltransferase domain-containing protein [Longitalea sp. SCSIO 12813]
MEKILQAIRENTPEGFDYEWLGKFVRAIDVDSLNYKGYLPEITDKKDYARNILCLEPFECVLLYWPPGVESAVHHHKGFWGYVLCLEGTVDNIEYIQSGDQLLESRTIRAQAGGVLNEPDNTIHKIVNPSEEEYLVTLHFYYPALDTLDRLRIFDLDKGAVATLNEKAPTASFAHPKDNYHAFEEDAFKYVSLADNPKTRSHRIYPIIPKPSSKVIAELIGGYYKEQALEYDSFDLKHESRRKYTERINALIADKLSESSVQKVLDLACGTGRRALKIREESEASYDLMGVDLSPEMCAVAQNRGVNAQSGNWLEMELPEGSLCAITFLYAYGHIPTEEERRQALKKALVSLKPGGLLFFDAFNLNDKNEWGPHAVKAYEEHNLASFGYEKGDVFYKKVGGEEVAFLHYCEEDSLKAFLEEIGFDVIDLKHIGYVHRSGEILDNDDEGALFVVAQKR